MPLFEDDERQHRPIPSNYQEMSILQLMEHITELADGSHLSETFFARVRPLTTTLSQRLGITPEQCALYALFIDSHDDSQITLSDLQRRTGARMVRLVQFQDDIDSLERVRFIRRSDNRGGRRRATCTYYVPYESLKFLRDNKRYAPRQKSNLSFSAFMRELDRCVSDVCELGEPYALFKADIQDLVNNNLHLRVARTLSEYRDRLSDCDWSLMALMCGCEMSPSKKFGLSTICKLYDEDWVIEMMTDSLESGSNDLLEMGLVEYGFADGLVDKSCITMSSKGRKIFMSECKRKPVDTQSTSFLQPHAQIAAKRLFYDQDVETQVSRLADLLKPKSFNDIRKRMKQHGMRQGFACLFYGAPGTGKTETVLQLAKATGRDIMQVNFSEIQDKYVGESEKRVKAIFDNYREAVKTERRCPILLFNEADALISKRLSDVRHAVDQMYNTLQNIILQEMEHFDGILIATTNLADNMDRAFERRFLYKIRFERPTPAVRCRIWQSVMPALTDSTALRLAQEHDFSGGQIENIARKQLVDTILYGEAPDLYTSLKAYCNEESIQSPASHHPIGFV